MHLRRELLALDKLSHLTSSASPTWSCSTPTMPFGDILSLLDANHWMVLCPYSVYNHIFSKQLIKAQRVEATGSW